MVSSWMFVNRRASKNPWTIICAGSPFSAHVRDLIHDKTEAVDPDALSFQFMREQLRLYRAAPEDTYETIRLEGTRTKQEGAEARDVHVYELHWSDLCRLQNRLFSIL